MSENTVTITDNASADALVAHIRSAVNAMPKVKKFVEANGVTRETIADFARLLADRAYPNDAKVQKKDGKRTRYGNAVQAAAAMMRKAIEPEGNENTPDYLALAIQAANTAHTKGEIETQRILDAIKAALV